jgi:anaerobic selenocysteine-containing dehydrogenase
VPFGFRGTREIPGCGGLTVNDWQREGHVRLNFEIRFSVLSAQFSEFLPLAEGNFGVSSGKAELYSEDIKAQGLDPVASFTPPDESRHGAQAPEFPIELLARKADNFLNSTFCNMPAVQEMEE